MKLFAKVLCLFFMYIVATMGMNVGKAILDVDPGVACGTTQSSE